jgi:D-alanine-D-alanine ligase
MRVGLTYDLRDDYLALGYSEEATAEFDSVETIDALANALQQLGFTVDRVGNLRALAARLVAGDRWDIVFNLAEGDSNSGRGREAQVPALLEAYGQPYVLSDSVTCGVTLDKALTKAVVSAAGVPVTPHVVVADAALIPTAVAHVVSNPQWDFPLFVKPLAEGTGKGCEPASKVATPAQLESTCLMLLERFGQPVIIEPFLPGREFTVGIIGNGAEAQHVAVMEVLLGDQADAGIYSYRNKENFESLVSYRLVDDATAQRAAEIALDAHRALTCRDASRADLRCNAAGEPVFMEINPLAGIHPQHSDLPIMAGMLGISYATLIARIMCAALKRCGLELPAELAQAA